MTKITKRMLIDATHHEETRVVVMDGQRLDEFDYESKMRRQLKGNIFLAKVTRVEPSLQAAFVNFGGNRHGFLPFSEIHPDYYRIPVADREALLAEQQAMEEAAKAEDESEDDEDNNEQPSTEQIDADGFVSEDIENGPEDVTKDIDAPDETEGDDDAGMTDDTEDEDNNESGDTTDDNAENDNTDPRDTDDAEHANAMKNEGDTPPDVATMFGEPDPDAQNAEGAQPQTQGEGEQKGRRDRNGRRGRWNNNNRRGGSGGGQNGGGRRYMGSRSKRDELSEDGPVSLHARFRRKYKIQEVIKRGQIMLVQASKEERGNKGAAVTTYLSLPGRYCVLMPNSPRGGGVSRKIGNFADRRRLKDMLNSLEIPSGMSVILRTAGVEREQPDIKRDLDYLLRLWDNVRELTLKSSAPAIIYEEGDLIKRAIRDIYSEDIEDIQVAGTDGFNEAVDFMKLLMPSDVEHIKLYDDPKMPLFQRYQVEKQINDIGEPIVNLKSGGYIVINQTEALVAIDVNSGRATKERHIEETALKTNLEAADEIARQLRLRDLGGLVVIDFIDMEDRRNNAKVERRVKEALSGDRARIQVSRISGFGLLELSRQRLNPSLTEATFQKCPHCEGFGHIKTVDFASIAALRALEEEGIRGRSTRINLFVANAMALYILNEKRTMLGDIERRYGFTVTIHVDDALMSGDYRIEPVKAIEVESEDDDIDDSAPAPRSHDRRDEHRHHHARPVAIDDQFDMTPPPDETTDAEDRNHSFEKPPGEDMTPPPRDRSSPDDRSPRRARGGRNRNRNDRGPRRDAPGNADGNVDAAPQAVTSDAPAGTSEGDTGSQAPRDNNRGPRRNNRDRNRGGRDRNDRGDRSPRPERSDRNDRPPRSNDGDFATATPSAPSEKSQPTYFVAKRRSANPASHQADTHGDVDGNRADGPETHTETNALPPGGPKKKGWWGRFS